MRENRPETNSASVPEKPRRRRWLQYSLRSLLVAMLVVGLGMTWVAAQKRKSERQRAVVDSIWERGGSLVYDFELRRDERGDIIPNPAPPGPAWLRSLLGDDCFASVVYATIPSGTKDVGVLTDLRKAAAADREFSDDDVKALGALTALEELKLHDTKLTDGGLAYVGRLKSLRLLSINDTRITDGGVKLLAGLDRIEDLEVGGTNVSDLRPFEKMPRLRRLDLTGTFINDAGANIVATFRLLEELDLSHTEVDDGGISCLVNCRNLNDLSLDSTAVTDNGLKYVEQLSQLKHLGLRDTRITDKAIESLRGLSNLRRLELSRNNITDAGLLRLSVLKDMVYVDLYGTKVTRHGIDEFRRAVPNCEIDAIDIKR